MLLRRSDYALNWDPTTTCTCTDEIDRAALQELETRTRQSISSLDKTTLRLLQSTWKDASLLHVLSVPWLIDVYAVE